MTSSLFQGQQILRNAWARWACDPFGDDPAHATTWEKLDLLKDLTQGDGADSDTFPTLVTHTEHGLTYYSFDGADDYFSDWPTMPGEYTVFAARSTSYPDGLPYVQSCNDTTIEVLLTTPGGFSGNLHSLVILDHEAGAIEAAYIEYRMLLRAWRQNYVDPITARLIRGGECLIQMYFEDETDKYVDYAQGLTATAYSLAWDKGIVFSGASSALVWDDSSLELESFSMIWDSPGWDLTPNEDAYFMENGTSTWLKMDDSSPAPGVDGDVVISMGDGTTVSQLQTPRTVEGYRHFAVTLRSGYAPRFFADGNFLGEGDEALTPIVANGSPLYLGNNAARSDAGLITAKKFSVFGRALTDYEVRILTLMSKMDRGF